jgi:ubiquitin carboxyl-terminal hydrolase 5/13
MQCGNLACGRAQFGGVGGNGHGLEHATSSKHPVAVKLGSITPDGTADVYCYTCDEERTDPKLAAHLETWGIKIAERQKTEKSLTELQIEQNLRWDFSMTTEDGKDLKPLFGPGLTGLKNLGNSCYLASTLQCLFSLPAFRHRYYQQGDQTREVVFPAEDLETQLRKMADGLLSGRYSIPETYEAATEHNVPHQKGLAPAMLKHLIGRGHEEFSTMRQQDAFELLLHLLKLITRTSHPAPLQDPVQSLRFVIEQRLQCLTCKKVRYRTDEQDNISIPVPARRMKNTTSQTGEENHKAKNDFKPVSFKECLDLFTAETRVDLACASCGSEDGFSKRSLFKTLPDTLAVALYRFEQVNWVPTKLDIPVVVSDEPFNLDDYISPGLQETEELLPEDAASAGSAAFQPDEAALQQLEGMGFPRVRGEKALHATGNTDAETAMNWLFAHMEDPDIDEPLQRTATRDQSGIAVSQESVESLIAMGIDPGKAKKALKETDGDIGRALDWAFSHPEDILETGDNAPDAASAIAGPAGTSELPATYHLSSIVCHKGASIHAGHYVAFIRKELLEGQTWVLFNDEKVVKAVDVEEMKKFAYVYFFERVA